MIGLNSFDPMEQSKIPVYGDRIKNLTTQYRSIRNIGELFSQFQYDGNLEHFRLNQSPAPLPTTWSDMPLKPITCLRFPCNGYEKIYLPQRLRRSPYQLYSAQLITEIIRWMSFQIQRDHPTRKWTIGIITPYRAQAQLIDKLLETIALPSSMEIVADTVHGFQGDECDIVFVVLNPPSPNINGHPAAFINKKHLINVAISRARDYLILVYPDENTKGIEKLNLVHRGAQNQNSIENLIQELPLNLDSITIEADQIENLLFGKSNYLQENTFTDNHQMVNVYADTTLHYIVRSDESSLDVQVKTPKS